MESTTKRGKSQPRHTVHAIRHNTNFRGRNRNYLLLARPQLDEHQISMIAELRTKTSNHDRDLKAIFMARERTMPATQPNIRLNTHVYIIVMVC